MSFDDILKISYPTTPIFQKTSQIFVHLNPKMFKILRSSLEYRGNLFSKYHQNTLFLNRSQLDIIFAKNPKTFHQELKKLRSIFEKVLQSVHGNPWYRGSRLRSGLKWFLQDLCTKTLRFTQKPITILAKTPKFTQKPITILLIDFYLAEKVFMSQIGAGRRVGGDWARTLRVSPSVNLC